MKSPAQAVYARVCLSVPYAAVVLLDELELPEPLEPLEELDAAGFESDEDFAPGAGEDDDEADEDAAELLDDEPRLSFR